MCVVRNRAGWPVNEFQPSSSGQVVPVTEAGVGLQQEQERARALSVIGKRCLRQRNTMHGDDIRPEKGIVSVEFRIESE
jgi:hypothetical protein